MSRPDSWWFVSENILSLHRRSARSVSLSWFWAGDVQSSHERQGADRERCILDELCGAVPMTVVAIKRSLAPAALAVVGVTFTFTAPALGRLPAETVPCAYWTAVCCRESPIKRCNRFSCELRNPFVHLCYFCHSLSLLPIMLQSRMFLSFEPQLMQNAIPRGTKFSWPRVVELQRKSNTAS